MLTQRQREEREREIALQMWNNWERKRRRKDRPYVNINDTRWSFHQRPFQPWCGKKSDINLNKGFECWKQGERVTYNVKRLENCLKLRRMDTSCHLNKDEGHRKRIEMLKKILAKAKDMEEHGPSSSPWENGSLPARSTGRKKGQPITLDESMLETRLILN